MFFFIHPIWMDERRNEWCGVVVLLCFYHTSGVKTRRGWVNCTVLRTVLRVVACWSCQKLRLASTTVLPVCGCVCAHLTRSCDCLFSPIARWNRTAFYSFLDDVRRFVLFCIVAYSFEALSKRTGRRESSEQKCSSFRFELLSCAPSFFVAKLEKILLRRVRALNLYRFLRS